MIRQREETFELDSKEKPLMVRFDEGNYLLKEWTFQKTTAELLYQLAHDDVIGRMWAASELRDRTQRTAVIAALRHTAREDDFWAPLTRFPLCRMQTRLSCSKGAARTSTRR